MTDSSRVRQNKKNRTPTGAGVPGGVRSIEGVIISTGAAGCKSASEKSRGLALTPLPCPRKTGAKPADAKKSNLIMPALALTPSMRFP
jgi:hypothetical protein